MFLDEITPFQPRGEPSPEWILHRPGSRRQAACVLADQFGGTRARSTCLGAEQGVVVVPIAGAFGWGRPGNLPWSMHIPMEPLPEFPLCAMKRGPEAEVGTKRRPGSSRATSARHRCINGWSRPTGIPIPTLPPSMPPCNSFPPHHMSSEA